MAEQLRALVTGASSGIGQGVARALVAEGIFVDGISSDAQRASDIVDDLGGAEKAAGHHVDLADIRATNEWVTTHYNRDAPDFVVHAAGVTHDIALNFKLEEEGLEKLEDLTATNQLSPYVFERRFASKHRKNPNAASLFFSTVSLPLGNPWQGEYVMSKGAVEGLSDVVGNEIGTGEPGKQKRSNVMVYGAVDTPMWNKLSPEQRAEVEDEMALGRAFTVGEAAGAAMSVLTGGHSTARNRRFVLVGGPKIWTPPSDDDRYISLEPTAPEEGEPQFSFPVIQFAQDQQEQS